jgi:ATP-dependent Clp protease ATP-binding subunit ClpB
MKRVLQSKVETLVARKLIAGDILPGQTIVVDADENGGFAATVE